MVAAPFLVACLAKLRDEFNALNPARDKGADGWIGDAAHQATASDHNPDDTPGVKTPYTDADTIPEVHALDIDCTGPWPQPFDDYIELIRLRHQRGEDDRLQNIIWRDRVASRSWGWTWQDRPGIGHFDHAHFSARYTTDQERDVSPWGVDDMTEIVKGIQAACKAAGYDPGAVDGVWGPKTQAALTAALKSVGARGPAGPQGPAGPPGTLPPQVTITGTIRPA